MSKKALEYHTATSYSRHAMSGHYLDWENQPIPFKIYEQADQIPLKEIARWHNVDFIRLFDKPLELQKHVSIEDLSKIFVLTHCLTAKAKHGESDFYYRSIASAGALYPFEFYVAVSGINDLPEGLYHHSPTDQSLRRIKSGNWLNLTTELLEREHIRPQLLFLISTIFFRSSWKYRDRAYRYHLLDAGHALENLTLALKYTQTVFKVHYDFNDLVTNNLIGVDPAREACMVIVSVGESSNQTLSDTSLKNAITDTSSPSIVSPREIEYSRILEIHADTQPIPNLPSHGTMLNELGVRASNTILLNEIDYKAPIQYPDVLFQRRSRRNFYSKSMSKHALTYLLHILFQTDDKNNNNTDQILAIGLLTSNVESFDSAIYLLNRGDQSVSLIKKGNYTEPLARICLEQLWLANCAAQFIFLANLDIIEEYGSRAYRYAMLDAGRFGQRLYLACTAFNLGCCGIGAFYDLEVNGVIGLNDSSRMLYLVGTGPITRLY